MDRQDIDALLIGALYGELTPADEARLATHLESHPADRGALDDLKSARTKVRESRIFELQMEPAQHISALLLQEAHRRAPKRAVATDAAGEQRDSWFWRFARSFMAHPAMAAAAMLVVVVGVASTLYVNKGEHFAERHISRPEASENVAMAPRAEPSDMPGAAGSAVATPTTPAEGSAAYSADLYDQGQGAARDRVATGNAEKQNDKAETKTARKESAADEWRADDNAVVAQTPPSRVAKNKGIAVTTEQPQPKDFERAKTAKMDFGGADSTTSLALGDSDGAANPSYRGATGTGGAVGASGGGGGGATAKPTSPTSNGMVTTGGFAKAPGAAPSTHAAEPAPAADNAPMEPSTVAPAPPPPPANVVAKSETRQQAPAKTPAPAKVATSTSSSASSGAKLDAPKSPDAKATDAKKVATTTTKAPSAPPTASASTTPAQENVAAWARAQHQLSIARAKAGDCKGAAQIALGVSNKVPDYYATYMATDRALKGCKSYIDAERLKEAERTKAAKAAKRTDASEAAPAK